MRGVREREYQFYIDDILEKHNPPLGSWVERVLPNKRTLKGALLQRGIIPNTDVPKLTFQNSGIFHIGEI